MNRKLYVGNLAYETSETDLEALFGQAGQVESVRVMRDKATGQARGFAFVRDGQQGGAQPPSIESTNSKSAAGASSSTRRALSRNVPAGSAVIGDRGGARAALVAPDRLESVAVTTMRRALFQRVDPTVREGGSARRYISASKSDRTPT